MPGARGRRATVIEEGVTGRRALREAGLASGVRAHHRRRWASRWRLQHSDLLTPIIGVKHTADELAALRLEPQQQDVARAIGHPARRVEVQLQPALIQAAGTATPPADAAPKASAGRLHELERARSRRSQLAATKQAGGAGALRSCVRHGSAVATRRAGRSPVDDRLAVDRRAHGPEAAGSRRQRRRQRCQERRRA